MNEKTLRALVQAGAVKRIHIIAEGARFHVQADTATGSLTASTVKGGVKTFGSLDAAAKWVHALGIGRIQVDVERWLVGQRGLGV